MVVPYLPYPSGEQPATAVVAVTKSDGTADPGGPFRAFLVDGSAGIIKFTDIAGNAVTLNNCAVGVIYPIGLSRVWNSVTTATDIYGLK